MSFLRSGWYCAGRSTKCSDAAAVPARRILAKPILEEKVKAGLAALRK